MNPQDLKQIMSSGLLSFPVTDFNADYSFNDPKGYAERLGHGWLPMVPARCSRRWRHR